jgi:hypothetical protein
LETELDILLEFRELLRETLVLELQLLILAGQLPDLRFQPVQSNEEIRHVLRKGRRGQKGG